MHDGSIGVPEVYRHRKVLGANQIAVLQHPRPAPARGCAQYISSDSQWQECAKGAESTFGGLQQY
jgi:hypothetical protein